MQSKKYLLSGKMASPTRLFLSPRLLSPLTPIRGQLTGRFLNVQFKNSSGNSGNIAKRLEFLSPHKGTFQKYENSSKIQIRITDTSLIKQTERNCLEVNTPCKNKIMENGLENIELDILGRGSFGTVIKATYKGENVAMKVIKLKDHKRYLGESLVLDLNHKNIVKTLEIIKNESKNYAIILMEYLNNTIPLQNMITAKDIEFTDDIVVKYSKDICAAINYCHQENILHLDIKPQNIIVDENNICKLCDFGNCFKSSKRFQENYQYQGTVAYAAPELLMGKQPTTKCDIYSFGIVLWQLLARKSPYEDVDHYELIVYKVVKYGMRPPSLGEDHSLRELYTSCWSTNPEDRPSPSQVLQYLNKYL